MLKCVSVHRGRALAWSQTCLVSDFRLESSPVELEENVWPNLTDPVTLTISNSPRTAGRSLSDLRSKRWKLQQEALEESDKFHKRTRLTS